MPLDTRRSGIWLRLRDRHSARPSTGAHRRQIEDGSATADRNLYVNGIDVNGTHYGSGVTTLWGNSTTNFTITTTH